MFSSIAKAMVGVIKRRVKFSKKCPMEETIRSNLAQKNVLTLAMARLKNLFYTTLHLLVSLRNI